MLQKRVPPKTQTRLFAGREAPGDDASRAHFQQQKQQLGQQQQQLQQQLQKLLLVFSFCSKLLLEFSYLSKCLFDFGLKTERMFDLLHLLEHKADDLTRPGQRPGEFLNVFRPQCAFMELKVCPDMTEVRILVKFRIQN